MEKGLFPPSFCAGICGMANTDVCAECMQERDMGDFYPKPDTPPPVFPLYEFMHVMTPQ